MTPLPRRSARCFMETLGSPSAAAMATASATMRSRLSPAGRPRPGPAGLPHSSSYPPCPTGASRSVLKPSAAYVVGRAGRVRHVRVCCTLISVARTHRYRPVPLQRSENTVATSPVLTRPEPESPPAETRPKWYRRPWIVPLFVIVGLFVALRLPDYLAFDTSRSLVPLQEAFPETHYLMLTGHILFGSIAIITCSLQVWPWLRQHHPKVHRISGRVYVFAGVIPSGLFALVVGVMTVIGPAGKIGNVLLAVLWLGTTVAGIVAARQRRYQDHRRWMIRSFALCTSIVANRVWVTLLVLGLMPFLDTYYGGEMDLLIQDAALASIWISWIVNLMIAQWWLDRKPRRGKSRVRA
ncbi:DUF2306 domain-containing protein [Antribacter gilvus]|uniref:DUF2306 domain-containing protein n=1 Tax=Antribacter gilvus TaxID=2304675 RepID=UPI003B832C6B